MVHIDPRHVKDCDCEDYPCCGHTDNIPSDEPYECDLCFTQHSPRANCPPDWEDEDAEELPEEEENIKDIEVILGIVYRKTDPYTRLRLIEAFCQKTLAEDS